MRDWIPLLQSLIWPILLVLAAFLLRKELAELLSIVRHRLEQGDPLSLGKLSLGSSSTEVSIVSPGSSPSGMSPSLKLALGVSNGGKLFLSLGSEASGEPSGWVGSGDALALAILQGAVTANPLVEVEIGVVRPRYARMVEFLSDHPNIVAIGGPMSNPITDHMMSSFGLRYRFDGLSVIDSAMDQRYTSPLRGRVLTGDDWGLLVRLPNPFAADGWVVLVAGIHGFGTHGAAELLLKIEDISELSTAAQVGAFEALLRVPVENGQIGPPELEAVGYVVSSR